MKKSTRHSIEKRIFEVLTGTIGEGEKIEFEKWLNAGPENRETFEKLKATWELTGGYLKGNKNWIKITGKINSGYRVPDYITTIEKRPKIISIGNWQKIAAAVLIVLAIGAFLRTQFRNNENIQLTAVEQVESNILPDGSEVVLNKGSEIEYSKGFNRKNRELTLKGEAFFSVAPDKKKPFLIHCLQTTTRVVGTKFNIYPDSVNNAVVVTVEEGIVEFYPQNTAFEKVILYKGEEGRINYITGKSIKSEIRDQNFIAWKTGKLIFDDASIDQVVLTLQKYFNTTIILKNNDNPVKITSRFADPELIEVLKELNLLAGIQSEFKNDTLFIK